MEPQEVIGNQNGAVLKLTSRAVKKIIETQDIQELKSQSFILQVVNVKIFDTNVQ